MKIVHLEPLHMVSTPKNNRKEQKMNNKAFTVVELLASFTITMIILIFLLEILLEVKNIYYNSEVKTAVYNKNAIAASAINKRLNQYYIVNVLTDENLVKSYCTDAPENAENIAIGTIPSVAMNNLNTEPAYFFISLKTNDTSAPEISVRGCDNSPSGFEDITIKLPENTSITQVQNEPIITVNKAFEGNGKRDSYIKITYNVVSNKLSENIGFNYIYTFSSQ